MNARMRSFEECFQANRAKNDELSQQVAQIEGVILQELSSLSKNDTKELLNQLNHQRQVKYYLIDHHAFYGLMVKHSIDTIVPPMG